MPDHNPFPWLHSDPAKETRDELRKLNRIDSRRRSPAPESKGYDGPVVAVLELGDDGVMRLVELRPCDE